MMRPVILGLKMILSPAWWSVTSLSLLSGCVHYQPQPIDLQTTRQALQATGLADAELSQRLLAMRTTTASSANESRLGQLDRAQLLVVAAERNPTLLQSRAALKQASAAVTTARALPNPTLSLGSEYSLSQTTESPWLWSLSTDWLLDGGLRRSLRIQLADTGVSLARLAYAEALWSVRSQLRTALLNYLVCTQRQQLYAGQLEDQQHLLTLQRQRVEQGEAAATEVLQVELAIARSRSDMVQNDTQQAATLAAISQQLGVPLHVLRQQQFVWQDWQSVSELDAAHIEQLQESALLSRPDLEQAVVTYQSRELELQQAMHQQYPQVAIGPGYIWDHGVHKASLGLSVTLPVFDRNQGPIAEAQAARELAGTQVLATQAQVLLDIETARATYEAALRTLQAAQQQQQATQALYDQTQRALELGAEDQVSLITAKLAAAAESLAVLNAHEQVQAALGRLEDALRTPLSGPELSLNQDVLTHE